MAGEVGENQGDPTEARLKPKKVLVHVQKQRTPPEETILHRP